MKRIIYLFVISIPCFTFSMEKSLLKQGLHRRARHGAVDDTQNVFCVNDQLRKKDLEEDDSRIEAYEEYQLSKYCILRCVAQTTMDCCSCLSWLRHLSDNFLE